MKIAFVLCAADRTSGAMMRYRILGRLSVWNGQEFSQLSAAKWRILLTCLLVNANRIVSADRLTTELWGEQAPGSAAKSLQVYVYRLRRALGPAPEDLLTRPGGYELSVAADQVDAGRFATLAGQGRQALAGGQPAAAVQRLTEAMSLWSGPALVDVPPTPTVLAEAERLEECRLAAWQDLADAKLAVGRHAELVAELRALVAEHPLREPLWVRLLAALHMSGRRSDALAAYAAVGRLLADELGVQPGLQLRQAHQLVLADSASGRIAPATPAFNVTAPATPATGSTVRAGGGREPACQLPARLPDFVGRDRQLQQVRGMLSAAPDQGHPPAVRTVLVIGKAGVGKSAFAVHVAHLVRDAFPDGQLFADLRAADNRPADPADVLAFLLKTLGVTGAELPDTVAERARRYRAELAGRRVLVVLDNAVHERQVRPLLPGTGGSAVLVTSRATLAGLEAAARAELDVLSDVEADGLLAAAAGDGRIGREPAAAGRLIRLCGNLPLALRIAGARLATRRDLSASRLADALDDERRRLDELVAGDLEVRSSVGLGYEALQPPARRALRLLGLLAAPTVPGWVVGALLDSDHGDAARATGALVDNHLLEFDGTDATGEPRYRLHDLVRLYARERAEAEEPAPARTAAVGRVCAAYAAVARCADERLAAGFAGPVPALAPEWRPREADLDRLLAAPLRWLDTERTTMCALVRQAAAAGLAGVAWRLAAALAAYFEIAAHFDDWRDTHEVALVAAGEAGDRLGTAVLHRNLGELNTVLDRYDEAMTAFEAALRAYREPAGRARGEADGRAEGGADGSGESAAASGLGVLLRLRGRYPEATRWLRRAIGSARAAGNARAEAYARAGLVSVHLERGDAGRAEREAGYALLLADQVGYRNGAATAHRCLGLARLASGRLNAATEELERAGELAVAVGDQAGEMHGRHWLAHIADVRGEVDRAERMLAECLAAYRRFGERFGEALTLRSQADLYLHSGRTTRAVGAVQQSLAIWRLLHSPYWTARTLDVLAAVAGADGRPGSAQQARTAARALRAGLGLPAQLRAATIDGREIGAHLSRPQPSPAGHRTDALGGHRVPA